MSVFKRMTPTDQMRTRAIEYAEHGWPVAPLAVPQNGQCPCEQGNCVEPHLIRLSHDRAATANDTTATTDTARTADAKTEGTTGRGDESDTNPNDPAGLVEVAGGWAGLTDPAEVAEVWAGTGWAIALVTSVFDVIDLPAGVGANLNHKLLTTCPTATAPRGRRWHFVLETGSLPADLIVSLGGRLHSGPTSWIAASPTRTEATGRIGWVVEPHMTRWQPYKRRDAMDVVFGRISTRETGRGLPTILTEGG